MKKHSPDRPAQRTPQGTRPTSALVGDLQPKWEEVWTHLYLGNIFYVSGQRERAVNEYAQAQRTRDPIKTNWSANYLTPTRRSNGSRD
jgi:hypothetical protein